MKHRIELAGKPFRPPNGTEGEGFMECFCYKCIHERYLHTANDDDKKCDILSRSLIHNINEPEYPKEWIHDQDGIPTCTSHVPWDWGNDGDPDDPDNPKAPPPPPGPNQLDLFPLYPDEKQYDNEKQNQVLRTHNINNISFLPSKKR